MPITFGIYDFFSYTVPGVLYLLAGNELLKVFDLPGLDVNQLGTSLGTAAFWVIVAYVVGQLMDSFAISWYTLFNKFEAELKAMRDFKRRNENLAIDFNLDDRRILHSVVRHNKPDVIMAIDSFKAISIMLNNLSLGLLLFGVMKLIQVAAQSFSWIGLGYAVAAFAFSYIAVKRSRLFNEWHWSAVFEHARQFGRSVPEMYGIKPEKLVEAGTKTTAHTKMLGRGTAHAEHPRATEEKLRRN